MSHLFLYFMNTKTCTITITTYSIIYTLTMLGWHVSNDIWFFFCIGVDALGLIAKIL